MMMSRDERHEPMSVSTSSGLGGTFRRSLRQMNPFKSRLFRLPATPRLTRARKVMSRAEESTNWNFERPLSVVSMEKNSSSSSSSPAAEPNPFMTVPADSPVHLRQMGGSCRAPARHSRPPIPSYAPKDAESLLNEHLHHLMVSPRPRQFTFLPDTSYSSNGEVSDAQWRNGESRRRPEIISPTHSTISLLNLSRPAARSMSYGSREESHRPQYHLNGLFHQPSLRSLCPGGEFPAAESAESKFLFTLADFSAENDAEVVFLGREWLFKELHQTVLSEQTAITLIRGANGTGKSAILRQLLLHSPFYSTNSSSGGDTVDSGISVQNSADFTSLNYEWLRKVSNRIVAYHECHLFAALSCSIPEFVRNIVSYLIASPLLGKFGGIIEGDPTLNRLYREESASLSIPPIELAKRLIAEPLSQLETPNECIILIVDGVDEAEFHRNENGESIATLINHLVGELPNWCRWVLSASAESVPFSRSRSIWIDDVDVDERVVRDLRLIADYRITVNSALNRKLRANLPNSIGDFADGIVRRAKGNALYITKLLDLMEEDRIRSTAPNLLPADLHQLFLLQFNCIFTSMEQFRKAAIILGISLSSLSPLTFEDFHRILNSPYASDERVTMGDLERRLTLLRPFLCKLQTGGYVLMNNSLRDWLLHGSNHTDYLINVRYGHILHSLSILRQSSQSLEDLFELGHHLLKANPHKYMPNDLGAEFPTGRDSQIQWIQRASGNRLYGALLHNRNLFYPNSKVSRLLLMAGASAHATLPDGDTLLCAYSRSGNSSLIQMLIQFGADVNKENEKSGMTPLMFAVSGGHLEATKCLLENEADPSPRDSSGNSALSYSVRFPAIFGLLVDTDFDEKSEQIDEAFEFAVQLGILETCQFIVEKTGVRVDLGKAMLAACSGGHLDVVNFLHSRGAKISANQNYNGKSALICAVESGSASLVESLLENGHSAEEKTAEGWTPLIIASRCGHLGLIDPLLDRGIPIDERDRDGRTALIHSVINEHFSTASLLADRGSDVNITDNSGNTLLHLLAVHFNKRFVERILEMGVPVDGKNSAGMRPVEVALIDGKQNAVDTFLRRGARLRSLTWRIAAEHNPLFVISLIRKLYDDGRTLYRRNRVADAMHRFHHALEKCSEFLPEHPPNILHSLNDSKLHSIRPQLRLCRCELLYTLADIKRQNTQYPEALQLSSEALRYADGVNVLFQLHFFRAKCFFDNRDVDGARASAQIAATFKPENSDLKVMLTALTLPMTTNCV